MAESVFPQHEIVQPERPMGEHFIEIRGGLTKREMFAAMAMQGLLAEPSSSVVAGLMNDSGKFHQWAATGAVALADALIAALASTPAPEASK